MSHHYSKYNESLIVHLTSHAGVTLSRPFQLHTGRLMDDMLQPSPFAGHLAVSFTLSMPSVLHSNTCVSGKLVTKRDKVRRVQSVLLLSYT